MSSKIFQVPYCIISKNHKSAILTLTELKSQFEFIARTDGTKAGSIENK